LTVSEQQAEQPTSEPSAAGNGSSVSASPDVLIETVMATVRETVEAPALATDHEALPKSDPPKIESKVEPEIETTKVEPKMDTPKVEAIKPEPPKAGKLLIMSPGTRFWSEGKTQSATAEAAPAKRNLAAMAAVVALATIAGAIGGALATAGLTHVADAGVTTSGNGALQSAIARIDADIVALKASLEQASKIGMSQFNKTSDRLDKVEKAQAEPAAKLAKLSEAVDKLRPTQAVVAAPAAPIVAAASPAPAASVAPKDVTGTVTTPAGATALPVPAASPATPPKTEVARLPTVEGWVLRDVGHGGALIEGRTGLYEVYTGDPVPGLGRIDAIRKQDGRWVVVTTRGLIVSR
jgi:hypothetical protein